MKLKLKCLTRTPHSEEISILDFDNLDEDGEPVSIGKVDLHYAEDQVVGTLLIAQEFAQAHTGGVGTSGQAVVDALIEQVLAEVSAPVGVAASYAVEVYYPSFASQGFFTNYTDMQAEGGAYAGGASPEGDLSSHAAPTHVEDDFARRLRDR